MRPCRRRCWPSLPADVPLQPPGRRRRGAVRLSWLARWSPGRRMINAYGPTETTVCATHERTHWPARRRLPIGRPIWNTRVYVLDGGFEACACGGLRGALHCGCGAGARLSGAFRADGGAVCGGPVRACREPDVPDRRPGALAPGWGAGVPRACRCAGEAARVPDRAGRDRGGADSASRGGAGGGDCA